MEPQGIDSRLGALLVCPIHRGALVARGKFLECPDGCRYPVFAGIPFLLPNGLDHTHKGIAEKSFRLANELLSGSAGTAVLGSAQTVDDFVQQMVAHTNSLLYKPVVGKLDAYPIPPLPMVPAHRDSYFLDLGCGWGRWCFAAAQRGFVPIGIDPSLESVLTAARIARQIGVDAMFVAADSRYLPFRDASFSAAYSYSVLQHFARENVLATLASLAPLLKPGAQTKLHLLNRYGLRSLQVQVFRGFRTAHNFETRYWTPAKMIAEFAAALGPTILEPDGFFVQGRYEDRALFRLHHRLIVELSHALIHAARHLPMLAYLADNLFVVSTRASNTN